TYRQSSTSGSTVTWTSPTSTAVGIRTVATTNGGLAKVSIDGSATAATMLPTAQQMVDSGKYLAGILVANGGTLNPTDRVLDCYSPNAAGTAGYEDLWDVRVGFAEGLSSAAHTVVITATGYLPS